MTDTIVDITFNNVSITETTDGGHTGFLNATLQADYTTGVVTVVPPATALTFSGVGIGGTQSYTTFTLTGSGTVSSPYQLTSTALSTHQSLTLHWTTTTPTSLTSASLVDTTNGHTYTSLNPPPII
jgi:hypothetical protein